jgi:hypothetical protein
MSVPTAGDHRGHAHRGRILKTDFERQAGSGGTKLFSFDDDWLGLGRYFVRERANVPATHVAEHRPSHEHGSASTTLFHCL